MTGESRRARRLLALALFVVVVGLGGATGLAAYRSYRRAREPVAVLRPTRGELASVRFSLDGRTLALVTTERRIEVHAIEPPALVASYGEDDASVTDDFSVAGDVVISRRSVRSPLPLSRKTARRLSTGAEVWHLEGDSPRWLFACAPRGDVVAEVHSSGGDLRSAADGRLRADLALPESVDWGRPEVVQFAQGGRRVLVVAVSRTGDSLTHVFEAASGRHLGTVPDWIFGTTTKGEVLTTSREGKILLSALDGSGARPLMDGVGFFRCSDDGRRVVFEREGGLEVWDLEPLRAIWKRAFGGEPGREVQDYALSSEGDRLAVVLGREAKGFVEVWELPPP